MADLEGRVRQRLLARRQILGMSQFELARTIAGLDPTALTRIETGKRRIQLNELAAFADALGVPLDYFLSPEPPPEVREHAERVMQRAAAVYARALT